MSIIAPPPSNDSLVETDSTIPSRKDPFYIAKAWLIWLLESLLPRIQQTAQVLMTPESDGGTLTDQHASIAAAVLPTGPLGAGTYRITYEARVTTIDGVASSLTVSLGWTEDGIALQLSGTPMVADSVSAPQSGSITVTIDDNTSLTYSTTYASTTPNKMRYKIGFTVEQI